MKSNKYLLVQKLSIFLKNRFEVESPFVSHKWAPMDLVESTALHVTVTNGLLFIRLKIMKKMEMDNSVHL